MKERWATLLKRAAATAAGVGSLLVAFPFDIPGDVGGVGGLFGMVDGALPWLFGLGLTGAVALSQALVWSKGERGGHDLGVAVSCLALLLGVVLGAPGFEAVWDGGGWLAALLAAAMPIGAAGLLRFAAVFPRPVRIEELQKAVDLGRSQEARLFRKLRGRPDEPDAPPANSPGIRGFWWLLRKAWPFEIVIAAVAVTAVLAGEPAATAGMVLAMLFGQVPALMALGMVGGLHRELSDPADRRRMRWVALGFGWAVFVAFLVPWTLIALGTAGLGGEAYRTWLASDAPVLIAILLGVLFVLAGIAVAMFKDGLFDPRLALRRTTIYGGATGALLLVFTGLEEVLSSVIAPALGLGDGAAGMIAGLSAAALFAPIRNAIRRWADRGETETTVEAAAGGTALPTAGATGIE